ncbi:MAG: type II toxin-antitoxin system prevent-host-death family antitoxin [Propionibacteriaceae bacterium]|jgi:prevent-host-death family protein|nr:type II toxin-antitoxin system prevent-host-death family antitoxin [Propionibacteriaceae bacterium]
MKSVGNQRQTSVLRLRYIWNMATVISQRELRNNSAQVMDRVERGEEFTVTRNHRPVAKLIPIRLDPAKWQPKRLVTAAEFRALRMVMPRIDLAELRRQGGEFFGDDGDRVG